MKKLTHILAYGYSILLYPLFVPTYVIIFYCVLYRAIVAPLSASYWLLSIGGTTFFTCFVPLLILLSMMLLGKVKDLDVSDAKERFWPYMYSLVSIGCWSYFLRLLNMPSFIIYSAIATTILLFLVALITLRWKISAHSASAGGAIAMCLGILTQLGIDCTWWVPALFIAAWLLMIARIRLDAHTPLQTTCGFLMGLILVGIPNIIFLYI